MKVLHGFPPNLQHSNVTKCVNANKPKKKLRIFPPTTPPFSTFFPHRLEFLLFFLVHAVYVPLLIYFSSHQIVSMMVYKQCPKDLIASASVLFSGLAEIRMSQKWEVVGRLMSLGDPPHFSSYLMDQVFLQDFLTTVETPYQLCTQEADHFSTTSGKWAAVHLPRVQVSFTDYSHCTIVAFSTNSSIRQVVFLLFDLESSWWCTDSELLQTGQISLTLSIFIWVFSAAKLGGGPRWP